MSKKTAVRRLSSFREKMKMKKMGKLQKISLFIRKKKLPNYCLKHSKGTQKYHLQNGNFFRENNICEERYPFISLKRRAKGRSFEDGYST